jgi:glycosyltransferase involved in cell wall biosynthesis
MKVLVVHNAYLLRGGEDAVVQSEIALLRAHGHEVFEYARSNAEVAGTGRLQMAVDTLWSRRTHAEVLELLARSKAQVVHVHNTLPLISPSVYWAAAEAGVPVVQTLHNFRLMCPQAMLLRQGRVCEECVGRAPWPAVRHGCYRGSRPQTAVLSGMLALHRALGTYEHKIARYIALNEFCRAKFVQGGLPAHKLVVKPNFVEDPGPAAFDESMPRQGLLFVGRLSPEKGLDALAEAARSLPPASVRVAGIGPAETALSGLAALTALGSLPAASVAEEMSRAVALVLPSIWYENFPRTLVEAFAAGLPVVASRIGALAELVEEGATGLLVNPDDAVDLAAKLQWALGHPQAMAEMGRKARRVYEALYSPAVNHAQLLAIYEQARAEVGLHPRPRQRTD